MTASRTGSRSAGLHAEVGQRGGPAPAATAATRSATACTDGLAERAGQQAQRAGRRSAMNAIERGSITALVCACGVRSTATSVWQQAWWITRPAATPTE